MPTSLSIRNITEFATEIFFNTLEQQGTIVNFDQYIPDGQFGFTGWPGAVGLSYACYLLLDKGDCTFEIPAEYKYKSDDLMYMIDLAINSILGEGRRKVVEEGYKRASFGVTELSTGTPVFNANFRKGNENA